MVAFFVAQIEEQTAPLSSPFPPSLHALDGANATTNAGKTKTKEKKKKEEEEEEEEEIGQLLKKNGVGRPQKRVPSWAYRDKWISYYDGTFAPHDPHASRGSQPYSGGTRGRPVLDRLFRARAHSDQSAAEPEERRIFTGYPSATITTEIHTPAAVLTVKSMGPSGQALTDQNGAANMQVEMRAAWK